MTHPITTLINSLLFFISWQRIADKLTGQRTAAKRFGVYLAASTILQFAMATAIKTVPILISLFYHSMLWSPVAFTIQGMLMWAMLYRHIHFPRAVSSVALSYFFFYGLMLLFDVLLIEPVYFVLLARMGSEIQRFWLFNLNIIIVHLGALEGSYLIGAVIDKVHFAGYYANFFISSRRSAVICAAALLLMHSLQILTWIFPSLENDSLYYITYSFLDLAVLFLILFIAVFETNREKVKAQEAFIAQQQIYVQTLESLQQELRTFRHDYQNLLSGLYLSAREGDSEALQKTLKQTMSYFDQRLGSQIQLVTELSRVQIPEAKSLLLVKLLQADEAGVTVKLEIPEPVTQAYMHMGDFLRCLGILIDNAIEAATAAKTAGAGTTPPDPAVRIALFQDEAGLFTSVSNPCRRDLSLSRLNQPGYTTKDQQSGTGLTSYKKIIRRYHNAAVCTTCEDGVFRQTLQIRRQS